MSFGHVKGTQISALLKQ